jgi:hypothetical protein
MGVPITIGFVGGAWVVVVPGVSWFSGMQGSVSMLVHPSRSTIKESRWSYPKR